MSVWRAYRRRAFNPRVIDGGNGAAETGVSIRWR
jgi:hypothetical protein